MNADIVVAVVVALSVIGDFAVVVAAHTFGMRYSGRQGMR